MHLLYILCKLCNVGCGKMKLTHLWKNDKNNFMIFTGNYDQFTAWRHEWFASLGLCKDFVCVHSLDTCGIEYACGDCSIFRHQSKYGCNLICMGVNCMDCALRSECTKEKSL